MTRSGMRHPRKRFGTLAVLGMTFFALSLFRSGDILVSWALAQTTQAPVDMPVAPKAAADPAQHCKIEPVELAAAFSEREARIFARERQIEERAAALALAEAALKGKLEDLTTAEARLRQTITMADGAAEADVARLTAVYESMKPKDAATLFEAMDPGFAAGFLGRMRPEVAAPILAGMAADKAYTVSVILAGRNAAVSKAAPASAFVNAAAP